MSTPLHARDRPALATSLLLRMRRQAAQRVSMATRILRRLACLLACAIAAPAVALDSGPERQGAPEIVILHAIGGPECRDGAPYFAEVRGDAILWADFFRRDRVLGIHYVVDRAGMVVALVPEDQIANHARGHNSTSIGIELVNNGDGVDPFPEAQVEALVELLRSVRQRYALSDIAITTHSAVDRGAPLPCGIARKVDPGPALDLARVIRDSAP